MIGLESCFGALNIALHSKVDLEKIISTLTINPRQILNLPIITIKEGVEANITLFNPTAKYKFDLAHIVSTNKNSGFVGKELMGKVIGVVNKNSFI